MKEMLLGFLIVIGVLMPILASGMERAQELPTCLQKSKGQTAQFKVKVQIINADKNILRSSLIILRGIVDDQVFDIARNRFGKPLQTPLRKSKYEISFMNGCLTKVSFFYKGNALRKIQRPSEDIVTVSSKLTSSGSYEVSDALRETIRYCHIKISVSFENLQNQEMGPEVTGQITCLKNN